MRGFTEAAAKEWAQYGIRVNGACAGSDRAFLALTHIDGSSLWPWNRRYADVGTHRSRTRKDSTQHSLIYCSTDTLTGSALSYVGGSQPGRSGSDAGQARREARAHPETRGRRATRVLARVRRGGIYHRANYQDVWRCIAVVSLTSGRPLDFARTASCTRNPGLPRTIHRKIWAVRRRACHNGDVLARDILIELGGLHRCQGTIRISRRLAGVGTSSGRVRELGVGVLMSAGTEM